MPKNEEIPLQSYLTTFRRIIPAASEVRFGSHQNRGGVSCTRFRKGVVVEMNESAHWLRLFKVLNKNEAFDIFSNVGVFNERITRQHQTWSTFFMRSKIDPLYWGCPKCMNKAWVKLTYMLFPFSVLPLELARTIPTKAIDKHAAYQYITCCSRAWNYSKVSVKGNSLMNYRSHIRGFLH